MGLPLHVHHGLYELKTMFLASPQQMDPMHGFKQELQEDLHIESYITP